ncbi:putative sulfate exporter family transporter [Herbiconiux moechotypicola]|uniref:Sulfate exporter family transporter n=1 Tax=Herbiconiux moechotypicola TaxID=637393 RepID=A0ABN3DW11_9MICO|nr:putative sulfate exporter family transporter [Herbiconiux moechotypicola]MCS5730936.1 putative sulfate exporter family transporter [Herbiconiux moechotypicola]
MTRLLPGLAVAAAATVLAFLVHLAVPAVPTLTAAVVLGVVVAQLPAAQRMLDGPLKAGLGLAARRLLRIGIVLLGLKLSLVDIASLGWETVAVIVAIVGITFAATLWFGRVMGLPGTQPILVAAGFSVCGASAVGAMSAVTRSKDDDSATPIALVTLCGTLAIAVLPALRIPLGLSPEDFGVWVGLSVHDVGQVVATAQIAGPAALAAAVVVKLTRVLTLAPMVAIVGMAKRRRDARLAALPEGHPERVVQPAGKRPPLVPLFIVGFVAAVLVRTFVLPLVDASAGASVTNGVLDVADLVQTVLFSLALFALGSSIRFAALARTGWRALVVGLGSWALIAALSLGAVHLLAA